MSKKFIITAREDVPARTRKKSKTSDLYDGVVEALRDPDAYSDVDVFMPSPMALASTVQLLLERGAETRA